MVLGKAGAAQQLVAACLGAAGAMPGTACDFCCRSYGNFPKEMMFEEGSHPEHIVEELFGPRTICGPDLDRPIWRNVQASSGSAALFFKTALALDSELGGI